jgi:type VI secretion system secreted protein VgrG
MAFLTEKKYSFVVDVLDRDTFAVVEFTGEEGLSQPYRFEVMLVSEDGEIDFSRVMEGRACFTIHREDGDEIDFHGVLESFEQLHSTEGYVFYRASVVPRLQWLSMTHHNQIFLYKTVPEVIEAVLKDGGLTSLDFEPRLERAYPRREYTCQYGESHLEFVSRWMEREGIYYYFEQGQSGEKVILTDTKVAHSEMPQGKTLYYSPLSGLDQLHREEVISDLVYSQQRVPKTLTLKDYNYRTPSLDLSGTSRVSPVGRGEVHIYGEHFRTQEEGDALARVRAEQLLCQEKRFRGESAIPYLRSGYRFDLKDHYRGDFNQEYLTIALRHEGNQSAFLPAGIQKGLSRVDQEAYYRNRFDAIPASVQFRAERTTRKARVCGALNAKIDAEGSGKYAELDEHGRYKVLLPFDESGREGGKASAWVRMAQPYAGSDHGMHFPLHKGTEVLLSFMGGNPDRPIIQGAVPNPETPSPVSSADQTMSKITTAGGNRIHMEDEDGNQRILLQSPTQNTWVRLGSPNDPGDPTEEDKEKHEKMHEEEEGYKISTGGTYVLKVGLGKMEIVGPLEQAIVVGNAFELIMGLEEHINLINKLSTTFIGDFKFILLAGVEFGGWIHKLGETTIEYHGHKIRVATNKLLINSAHTTVNGKKTEIHGDHTHVVGNATEVNGDETQVKGDATEVVGSYTHVQGNATKIVGDGTSAFGGQTKVEGNRTSVGGKATKVSGSSATVNANVAAVQSEKTTLSGTVQELTAMHFTM